MKPMTFAHRQRGVVMFTALILMVMMLLVAISSFNMGRQNTVIAGNMQNRAEAISSANRAVEEVLSTTNFTADPTAALPGNQVSYDVNGDGTNDILVALTPQPCLQLTQTIPTTDLENWLEVDCSTCPSCVPPADGMTESLCKKHKSNAKVCKDPNACLDAVWQISAVATDAATGAATTVTRGVGVRISSTNIPVAANFCP